MTQRIRRGVDRLAVMARWRWWALLTLVALGTRFAWAAAVRDRTPQFDEAQYVRHAIDLVDGRGYVDDRGLATAYWPVGFPAVLAGAYRIFGVGPGTGVALQIGLGVATCFLLAAVGARAFGPGLGRAGALVLAAYPNHVVYSTLHLTEPLAAFLVMLAALLILRDRSAMAAGLSGLTIGLAVLVRPTLILLPGVLGIWYWRFAPGRRAALLRTGAVCLGTVLAVSPWVIRNHRVTGRWTTVSTTGGHVFWMGNSPEAFGGYRHAPGIVEPLPDGDRVDYDRGYRLGVEAILDGPLEAGVRAVRKLTYFAALETDGVLWNLKGLDRLTPLWVRLVLLGVVNAFYFAVVTLAILGVIRAPPRDPTASLLVLLAGYMAAMAAIFIGDPRYHYALIPLACLFATRGAVDDLANVRLAAPWRSDAGPGWAPWAAWVAVFSAMVVANLAIKVAEVRALGG